jgi:anti-sigma factor RsiW
MPVNPTAIPDAELSAHADRQLAPERAAAVESALAEDPALAARVAEIRAQNAALHDALDPILAEPIPERLLAAACGPGVRRTPNPWLKRATMPALAAAATLALGIGVGWFARDLAIERSGTPTTFARQVAITHVLYAADARRPVEVWANEEQALARWLTRRLGFTVKAPDLNSVGYSLVGGRLVAGNEKPTALFMYENAEKERLSLQIRKQTMATGETAFRYAIEDGVGVFYWIDDNCGYAISGKIDRAQLLAVARVVYGQVAAIEAAPAPR